MTTKEKIAYFTSECQRFIDFFGLHEWQIYFGEHEDSSARSMCFTSGITDNVYGDGMMTELSYNKDWLNSAGKNEISVCAFHEIMELLLSKLRDYSTNDSFIVSQREVDDEVHRIIRRFENKIHPLIK